MRGSAGSVTVQKGSAKTKRLRTTALRETLQPKLGCLGMVNSSVMFHTIWRLWLWRIAQSGIKQFIESFRYTQQLQPLLESWRPANPPLWMSFLEFIPSNYPMVSYFLFTSITNILNDYTSNYYTLNYHFTKPQFYDPLFPINFSFELSSGFGDRKNDLGNQSQTVFNLNWVYYFSNVPI